MWEYPNDLADAARRPGESLPGEGRPVPAPAEGGGTRPILRTLIRRTLLWAVVLPLVGATILVGGAYVVARLELRPLAPMEDEAR